MMILKISHVQKRRLQWIMLTFAAAIVLGSLWITQNFVKQISEDERRKVKIWASAIQRKAQIVDYAQVFFQEVQLSERIRVEQWAEAYQRYIEPESGYGFSFYRRIIDENTSIPCIATDAYRRVLFCKNTDFDCSNLPILGGSLLREFSQFPPINIYENGNLYMQIYYKQSKVFSQLQLMFDELAHSFMSEVVDNSISVPVLVVDQERMQVVSSGNIDADKFSTYEKLQSTLNHMASQNKPIEILGNIGNSFYIYYENSALLSRLQSFPLFVLITIAIFILGILVVFRLAKRSEDDKLWVGMSRETAHQLGTPLSSLMAWVEYLKMQNVEADSLNEIQKDIDRLKMIAERFSKIGSEPALKNENIVEILYRSVSYLRARLSDKIVFDIDVNEQVIMVDVNSQLVEWVIENIAKNAVDAIGAKEGQIKIEVIDTPKEVSIDISDNGKGMHKSEWKQIFQPGYTTKARGWGLGLALSYRIIRDYHKGRIFVKHSVIGKGTCIRICLFK